MFVGSHVYKVRELVENLKEELRTCDIFFIIYFFIIYIFKFLRNFSKQPIQCLHGTKHFQSFFFPQHFPFSGKLTPKST